LAIKSVRDLVYTLTGNYYSEDRLHSLKQKIVSMLKDRGEINSEDDLNGKISMLLKKKELADELINYITINETSFFRHKEQLKVFSDNFLDDVLKNPIGKILSAGCSTGEEPYTLAMIMLKKNPTLTTRRVVGIDISTKALNTAKEGKYPYRSINYIPEEYRDFVEVDGRYIKIKENVKSIVDFHKGNVVANACLFKSMFSAVFFRNVLIYFTPEKKRKALENLNNALKPDGVLVLAPTESIGQENLDLFKPFKIGRFTFFRKK